ncbi:hypothetical protein M3640_22130, partial [Bacillus velezensis]|nr:hypothetical protein [Bacillus velezensis]
LFMQAVRPDTPLIVQIGYGAFIAAAHAGWFSLVALCFSATAVRDRLLALRHWIDRTFGCLLVGFGVALAAFAGVLAAPVIQVSPLMGQPMIITVFAVVVIGGLGSLGGAFVASLAVGFAQTFAAASDTSLRDLVQWTG